MGVFAGALIKKYCYWPKHVPENKIEEYFEDKEVGAMDSLKGKLHDVHYDIFCMKEPDYVMKIMSTYGGLIENDWQKESVQTYKDSGKTKNVTFKYKILFSNNFDYRHVVDDHNNVGHQVPSLEQTWTTHRWPVRVFSFLLAVSEVNCYPAHRCFVWDEEHKMGFMAFRSKLAWALINNDFRKNENHWRQELRRSRRWN